MLHLEGKLPIATTLGTSNSIAISITGHIVTIQLSCQIINIRIISIETIDPCLQIWYP